MAVLDQHNLELQIVSQHTMKTTQKKRKRNTQPAKVFANKSNNISDKQSLNNNADLNAVTSPQRVDSSFLLAKQQQASLLSPNSKQHRLERLRTQNNHTTYVQPVNQRTTKETQHKHATQEYASLPSSQDASTLSSKSKAKMPPTTLITTSKTALLPTQTEQQKETTVSSVTNVSYINNEKLPNTAAGIDFKVYEQRVRDMVKKIIFPKLKFITSDTMLAFSTKNKSLCQIICQEFHITSSNEQQWFWVEKQINNVVLKTILKKRSDATANLKKGFMGKLFCMYVCVCVCVYCFNMYANNM